MKRLIYLSLAFVLASTVATHAQGNLQFNRVVNYEMTLPIPTSTQQSTTQTITVAAGKVLKIENVFSGLVFTQSGIQYTQQNANNRVLLNNVVLHDSDNFGTGYVLPINMPMWLPTGSYTLRFETQFNPSSYTNISAQAILSCIEFNIVP